jgi:Kelch motif
MRTNNVIVGLRDGRVLVANGDHPIFGTQRTALLFDPATETWSTTGSTMAARRVAIGALLNDGRVLVVGEPTVVGDPFAEVYDPATETWSATGPMVSPRTPDTVTSLLDGRVLGVGNEQHNPELYDPVGNSWAPAASLQTARTMHEATRLADGRVLVAGGFAGRTRPAETTLASVEIYDPGANTWTAAAPLTAARTFGHSATTLADGRVLVAGGDDDRLPLGERILDSAEVYNPATNTWTATRPMTVDRLNHLAVLLSNGKVLAVGGTDDEEIRTGNGTAKSTAELFRP